MPDSVEECIVIFFIPVQLGEPHCIDEVLIKKGGTSCLCQHQVILVRRDSDRLLQTHFKCPDTVMMKKAPSMKANPIPKVSSIPFGLLNRFPMLAAEYLPTRNRPALDLSTTGGSHRRGN